MPDGFLFFKYLPFMLMLLAFGSIVASLVTYKPKRHILARMVGFAVSVVWVIYTGGRLW